MARLIRLDDTGHTTLAEWTQPGSPEHEAAVLAFRAELEQGYFGVLSHPDGSAEQVRELPHDGTVILRRPIAGG